MMSDPQRQIDALAAMMGADSKRLDKLTEIQDNRIEEQVAAGVRRGLREALSDQELMSHVWGVGYQKLAEHASDNAARWIGRRILVSLATVAFVVSLTYLVKSGTLR